MADIPISAETLGALLICSVRYACGRRTYMPGVVADAVRAYGPQISAIDRETIRQSILDQHRHGWGDDVDIQVWRELLGWLDEQEERSGG